MDPIFREQEALSISAHEMILEVEEFEVCKEYDGGGDPPHFRIVLKSPEIRLVCGDLHELACAVSATKFPIIEFIEHCPEGVASMVANLEGRPGPVLHNDWFKYMEAHFNVRLSDIKPQLENDELRWFERPTIYVHELTERRLSVTTLTVTGGKRIPPVVRYGYAPPKPEA
ncbi:MAG: hypothetical protein JWM59_4341 [Verrucomicrobiales bacterium]|nr:hypothetical protein [Verrucomicrobiales bacterium]